MLFPQAHLKQYAGLHVDALVVPVVCIRVSFAIKSSPFSLLISRRHGIKPKLNLKLMSVQRVTNFGPMIHFTCLTIHIIYIHIALYPFSMHGEFSISPTQYTHAVQKSRQRERHKSLVIAFTNRRYRWADCCLRGRFANSLRQMQGLCFFSRPETKRPKTMISSGST